MKMEGGDWGCWLARKKGQGGEMNRRRSMRGEIRMWRGDDGKHKDKMGTQKFDLMALVNLRDLTANTLFRGYIISRMSILQ